MPSVSKTSSKKSRASRKPRRKLTKNATLPRAPIVAVLGHVDHGKTTLLDFIRQTKIQQQETGGITQHIGAYQIKHHNQPITFIDTPGHAAFAKMRRRGAAVTDLVILVVAADDGVKPQTKESIKHIKAANVPVIVAINKMDLPSADTNLVKSQLVESDIKVEGFGGDVVAVETVATSGKGVKELLDMILLVAQMQPMKGNPQGKLEAVIIESRLEKNIGTVATVIVKTGTLKRGDKLVAGLVKGIVRRLANDKGVVVEQALPGEPAEILGFKSLPPVGEQVTLDSGVLILKETKTPSTPPSPTKAKDQAETSEDESEDEDEDEDKDEEEKPQIKAVIKADTQGTLEAIKANVTEEVNSIGEGVGDITQSDILLAQATGARILAFRVKTPSAVKELAKVEGVEINTYSAIYKLLEDLASEVLKLLEPTIDEEVIGEATITAKFKIKKQRIAGCQVSLGKLEVGGPIHLIREEKIIGDATIRSLRKGKRNAKAVKKDEECGALLRPSLDFKLGDKLQYYRVLDQE